MEANSNINREEYVKLFCKDRRIRKRIAIYVGEDLHTKLRKIANAFSDTHVSLISLADSIIRYHIDTHRDFLEEEYQEYLKRSLELLRGNENQK